MLRGGHRCRQRLKPFAEPRQYRDAGLRHCHALRRALENRPPQLRLGLDHLLADGADGHAKLIGSRLQRPEPPHSLQCPETIQMNAVEILHIEYLYQHAGILN